MKVRKGSADSSDWRQSGKQKKAEVLVDAA
jgi:hypothetical protein